MTRTELDWMNYIVYGEGEELNNFQDLGVVFQDRVYNKEEIKRIDYQTRDYIMSQSTKNGDIPKTLNKFESSLEKLIKYE